MDTLEHFEMGEGYACFRPVRNVCIEEGIDLVGNAIAFARDQQIPRLLVDTTQLTGFPPLETWDRYHLGKRWAKDAQGVVIVSVIAREKHIDPQRFGLVIARNRGMVVNVFAREAKAIAWLLDPQTANSAEEPGSSGEDGIS